MAVPRIIVTSGEPAGIGPDICVSLAQHDAPAELVIAGDARLLAATAKQLRVPLSLVAYDPARSPVPQSAGSLTVLDMPTAQAVIPGILDARNAPAVIDMLNRACDGCLRGEFAAMVTAPVQKSTLMEAGFEFTGHTEYLAARCGTPLPVMMLLTDALRVALVTTHLALADVPRAITHERLLATLRIVHRDLRRFFAMSAPRIMVLGLNPHAGESGYLGREEIEIIEPSLLTLRAEGLNLRGPVPADTAFAPGLLAETDVVVAMYHDQGLPVLKHVGFGNAVNMTLGLPILRTSVDHGTALSLARSGKAEGGSLWAAVSLAAQLANHAGP